MKIRSIPLILMASVLPVQCGDVYAFSADIRYCYDTASIPRDSKGEILRDQAVIRAFKKAHPCPVTKVSSGSCAGWQVNHVIPLAVGGCDAMYNLQWLPNAIKTCQSPTCVDRFERTIYSPDFGRQ